MYSDLKEYTDKIQNFKELSASEQVDFFAFYCSVFKSEKSFRASHISNAFSVLRLQPYSNISQYLSTNSKKTKTKKTVKYISSKNGYHIEANFEEELRNKIKLEEEVPFINYKINNEGLSYKPSDIPHVNKAIRKNAEFFTTLYYLFYHLENSIRKFLLQRLISLLGNDWEVKLLSQVDLAKACSIRKEVNLSEMLPERGDNILYYCMWDDYAKIIVSIPNIFNKDMEKNEILAHLSSLGKIRNAIAHNAVTIPKVYQDELTIFLTKYTKILKSGDS